jgi:uncharacterized protein YndB with AHSA1/START domain
MASLELALDISQQIEIAAPPAEVFAGLLAQMGEENRRHDGVPMPMRIEPLPGGRWFRDLGENAGHLWGHVQVIKPPQLLELCGPMFMSYPVVNWLQYRLEATGPGTRLTLRHQAIGPVAAEHREGVQSGWRYLLERLKDRCE